MINLADIFPESLASKRSRNAKLEPDDDKVIDDLALRVELVNEIKLLKRFEEKPPKSKADKNNLDSLEQRLNLLLLYNKTDEKLIRCLINQVAQLKSTTKQLTKVDANGVSWQECIEILASIKKKLDRTGVIAEGEALSSQALPVKFVQIFLYICYTYDDVSQANFLNEFKRHNTVLNKKIFNLETTLRDYERLVNYNQPFMHINYHGHKKGKLAEAIKNLTFQSGKHSFFVDVFGGSGASTLAVPRKNNTKYVYNDLDKGLYCLYKVLSHKKLKNELILYLEYISDDIKYIVSKGETGSLCDWSQSIDFEYEVQKYYENKKYKDTAEQIVEFSTYENIELKYNVESGNDTLYHYIKYYFNCLCTIDTPEAIALRDKFPLSEQDVLDASKFMLEYSRGTITYAELTNFAKNNGIDLLVPYGNKSEGGTTIINNYDKMTEQFRYFVWYAYFNNCLKTVNEYANFKYIREEEVILLMSALAEIYIWSFLHNNNKSPSAIYKINHANGTSSTAHLKFLKNLPTMISHINTISNLISDGKTIVENETCIDVINKYATINNPNKVLYYSDSPYIETFGYSISKWDSDNSKELIDTLISSNQNFIFSCRACANTKNTTKAIKTNRQTYDAVLKYFDSKTVEVVNKITDKKSIIEPPLWVTYINLDKLSLEDAIKNHKKAEIMITNYEIQPFGSPDVFRVMTYDEFMEIINKHLEM